MCNLANHTIWCDCHTRPSLKEQLAQARREGWEQGKKEAFEIARTTQIGYIQTTIAAMEYKGESK